MKLKVRINGIKMVLLLVVFMTVVFGQKRKRIERDEPPFDYRLDDVPIFWWDQRDDVRALSCLNNTDPLLPFDDLLFRTRAFQRQAVGMAPAPLETDWQVRLKESGLDEKLFKGIAHKHTYMHSHWFHLRPFQHSFFNLLMHEQDFDNVHCPLGFLTCCWVTGVHSMITVPQSYPTEIFMTLWPIMWEVITFYIFISKKNTFKFEISLFLFKINYNH